MNNKSILDKKKFALNQTLVHLASNNITKISQEYCLIYLNILQSLEGFDYKLFLNDLKKLRTIYEYRILFIILESISKDYYISTSNIIEKYNLINSIKYSRFNRKEKDLFASSIINVFSILIDCNKNFRSDKNTYIEYIIKDDMSSIINFEKLFSYEIINNLKKSLNKDKSIEDFTNKYTIKDLEIIDKLRNEYDLIFKNIKSIYHLLDVPNEIKKPNKEKQNSILSTDLNSKKSDIYSEEQKEDNIISNDTKQYKKVTTPFVVPNIQREDTYKIHNKIAYFNMDIFDENIKKEIYEIIPNASNYSLPYNKNKILLQLLAKNEIMEYAKDLINDLKENNIAISDYGFSRIYDIHKSWSNFRSNFSLDYRDFLESKAIKEKDYFEIILEYKKGTATRDYLDLFLKEQKYNYFDILHDDEFEVIVDNALYNWNRDIKDIVIFSPDYFNFFKGVIYAPVFDEKNIEKFIPEDIWIENKITFDINEDKKIFDKINSLKEYYQVLLKTNISDSYELLKRLKDNSDKELTLFWFNIFKRFEKNLENVDINTENGFNIFSNIARIRINDLNDFFKNSFNSPLKIEKLIYEHEKWIFEYNKSILESKKRTILEALENYTKNS